jgi:hypothetical protein
MSAVAEQEQQVSTPRPTATATAPATANHDSLTMFDVFRLGLSAQFFVGLAVSTAATYQGMTGYFSASDSEAGLKAVQTASGLFGTGLVVCVATALCWSVFEVVRRKWPAAG